MIESIVVAWPVQVPLRIPGGMAASIELERTREGSYPPEWPGVAWLVKTIAGWKCERCGRPNSGAPDGFCLTVHHLDGQKWNLQHWNLAALCAKCHLKIQTRVHFYQVWAFEHSRWMAVHVAAYNEWAARLQPCPTCHGAGAVDKWVTLPSGHRHWLGSGWLCEGCNGMGRPPLLPLEGIVDRDYSQEWA